MIYEQYNPRVPRIRIRKAKWHLQLTALITELYSVLHMAHMKS